MGVFRYLSHPQVIIDPDKAVRDWILSEEGRARAAMLIDAPGLGDTQRILTSSETKALQTAQIIADGLQIESEVIEGIHEIDRSATGFLPDARFVKALDQFYAAPEKSYQGWETASAALERIVSNIFLAIMMSGNSSDILCVGHGTVGTLLYCHLKGVPMSRDHAQPDGGGHLFAFDMQSDEVLHPWMSIEAFSDLTGMGF